MISIQNLAVRFGGFTLFEGISVMITEQEKIGLVGRNGAGKSTLLKIIAGIEESSEGEVIKPSNARVGYLPQQMESSDGKTVMNEMRSAFGDIIHIQKRIDECNTILTTRTDYESDEYLQIIQEVSELSEQLSIHGIDSLEGDAERMLLGLGFERTDFDRNTSEFSGGWRMRIELAKLLLQKPEILLLDEPTNHLDIVSIQWLEQYLTQYKGIIILISHDRAFLDAITQKTFEISLQKLTSYPAPYSKYLQLKDERYEQQIAAYENQQKMISDTEKFIERFRYKATKAIQVQSRIKQLDKIERIEVEKKDIGTLKIAFPPAPRAGSVVLKTHNLTKKYGDKTILKNVNLVIERGQKVALLGKNGEGKSTCIKAILKEIDHEGTITLGHNVELGYFAQNQDEILDNTISVFETLDAIAVGEIRTKVRDILGAFFFSGEDVDKKVRVLSGGERNRLAMAKLMLQPYNLLILDEPTNHLDIQSKAVLKEALQKYDGTVILVSHDRDFLEGLTTHIYEVKQTQIKEVIGDLHTYLNNIQAEEIRSQKKEEIQTPKKNKEQNTYSIKKEQEREIRKIKTSISRIEQEIEHIEEQIHTLNTLFIEQAEQATAEHFQTHAELQEQLQIKTHTWENLVEKLAEIEL